MKIISNRKRRQFSRRKLPALSAKSRFRHKEQTDRPGGPKGLLGLSVCAACAREGASGERRSGVGRSDLADELIHKIEGRAHAVGVVIVAADGEIGVFLIGGVQLP